MYWATRYVSKVPAGTVTVVWLTTVLLIAKLYGPGCVWFPVWSVYQLAKLLFDHHIFPTARGNW